MKRFTSGLAAVFGRELRAYFVSPMAWVILTLFLFGNGISFTLIVSYLADPRSGGISTPLQVFFGSFFFWLMLFVLIPLITMRSIAEERRSGTLETLMTAPVSETTVVLAKFAAALVFYTFLWLPTLAYVAILGRGATTIDWGPIASGYLGVLALGAMFLAIGLFASALSKNQIVAAILTFVTMLGLFTLGFLDGLTSNETLQKALSYLNVLEHMDELAKGIVDTRRLIYYLSTTVLFLFLASRALEQEKWR